MTASPPLIVHLLYRFDTGGLENGVVNLINHFPPDAYRHAVVALTDVVPAFAARLRRTDVECIGLGKPAGHGAKIFPKFWRLLRELRPAIVHSRNMAALECQVVSAAAGVPVRIHSEHGRDLADLNCPSRRYVWMRRAYGCFVHRYVALSGELERYLQAEVGVAPERVSKICNGVDASRFVPRLRQGARMAPGFPFGQADVFVFGTAGRMQPIKNQILLAQAFIQAVRMRPELGSRLRLAMVGEGPQRRECQELLTSAGLAERVWLPGEYADMPAFMASLDAFVLPSISEGISNTILEAMSSGLPVLATDVGGNAELVLHARNGEILPSGDVDAMARSMLRLCDDPSLAMAWGRAGRDRVLEHFSLQAMVRAYQTLYEDALSPGQAGASALRSGREV